MTNAPMSILEGRLEYQRLQEQVRSIERILERRPLTIGELQTLGGIMIEAISYLRQIDTETDEDIQLRNELSDLTKKAQVEVNRQNYQRHDW
jgi:hypothetical protein